MVTMLLGGLWHGAGWNFLVWGGLHGVYLSINHLWREWRGGDARASATDRPRQDRNRIAQGILLGDHVLRRRHRLGVLPRQDHGGGVADAGRPVRARGRQSAYASPGILRLMDLPILVGEARLLLIGGGAVALALAIALVLPNVPQLFGYREYRRAPEPAALAAMAAECGMGVGDGAGPGDLAVRHVAAA